MNEIVQTELKKIFDGRFSTSESTRSNYARGEDTYDPVPVSYTHLTLPTTPYV